MVSAVAAESLSAAPEILAAIDIGTNSIHLVVARMTGPHAIEVLGREKEMVRLGSGAEDLTLTDDAIDRGVQALARFREIADSFGASVSAVATSAVREAENRQVFLDRARLEAGVEVEVISGFEEARLIHLGVLQAVAAFDQRIFLCDIGGGSTELLVGRHGESLAARSLKMGAIRLTQRFFSEDKVASAAVDSCRRYVRSNLSSFTREVRRFGFDIAVGSSGTMATLAAMALARTADVAPKTWNNFVLTRSDLKAVVKSLIKAPTVEARAKLPGMDPRRSDIILAGALILEQIYEEFDIKEMVFSDYALREGVLLDAWRRHHGGSLHHLSDLRRRSVLHLAEQMDDDPVHSQHVARLVLSLFDQTCDLHELGDDAREYLEAAALLCNLGLFLSHAGHHRHSYYMIRNSEHLTGFTNREIELIAQIARYHRKSGPSLKHPEFAALSKQDQALVRRCAGLLRIAIGLDRTHGQKVTDVQVVAGKTLRVEARARDGADIGLELFSASQRADLAAEALGLPVEVVAVDD
ncbi:MAG TPA: Ppx/GppA phosphatase family protein [Actinomycetota bacterium]|nr:Ppx/GppA phosphatase family protein [Actinomycetota bacterium]